MENTKTLTDLLFSNTTRETDALLEKGRTEAAQIIAEHVTRAEAEIPRIEQQYRQRAKEMLAADQLREKMGRQRALSSARQAMADEVILRVREKYSTMDDADYLTLLRKLLEESTQKAGGEKPVVYVPERLHTTVQAALGHGIEVQPGRFTAGFILSFSRYDLNYEAERLFENSRDELELYAMRLLFEEDTHA